MRPTTRERLRTGLRWLLAAAFVAAGYFHLAHPQPFLAITPGWVPAPRTIIWVTGLCELAGAVALFIPRLRWLAGVMLALYAVCVYPANVQHMLQFAAHHESWTGWLYHVPRLLFQPVIVWWCLFAGKVIDWPFSSPSPLQGRGPGERGSRLGWNVALQAGNSPSPNPLP